ncbi:DUF5689 domain-containing protein [Flavobacterium psychrotrophum]|uniref:DUF5689 domain-containing protein n=1 Tax=Flavobacterium psychrotrophum TaxID=2294119 RepID=UPI000E30D46A|nr:DUF5689 domain-containing protein [Flavobacterium psychrotrophum]
MSFLKPAIFSLALATLLTGCVNNDDYGIPLKDCVDPGLTTTKTVADIFAASTTVVRQYTADDIIEAYVTSSDERGNIFKTVYLQTLPAQGTPVGFSIAIDRTSLFGVNFYPGKKVVIKLKDLYYARVNGALALGALYNGAIGRIAEYDYKKFTFPTCDEVSEDQLVRSFTLTQAVSTANLNTLIELTGVQFDDAFVNGTYYDENDTANTAGGSTNRKIVSAVGGNVTVEFRTSSFSNFAGDKVPGNSGKIRGILTKYNDTYQFLARSAKDVNLTEPRFDAAPPIIGGTIAYGTYNETFESYTLDSATFNNAVNDAITGIRYWQVKSFNNNKYIQVTAFGGGNTAANRTIYAVPANFTTANTFSFQTKDGYNTGEVLKVYYSTNYTPGGDINAATLVDITSNFAIATGTANGYANNFTNSGDYAIPATLTGNGFFIFEYVGNGRSGPTTTMQIDNVKVQ